MSYRLEAYVSAAVLAVALLLTRCAGGATFSGVSSASDAPAPSPSPQPESSGDADQTGTPIESGSDEPAWVNGMYLACAWAAPVSERDAAFTCDVRSASGAVPALTGVVWTAVAADGTVVAGQGDGASAAFVLGGALVPDAAVVAETGVTADASAPLAAALPGLTGDLAGCLRGGNAVDGCLEAAGVTPSAPAPAPAAAPAPAPAPVVIPSQRADVGGIAYYLGDAGKSCDETCAGVGGPVDATISVVGSGGSTAQACVEVLDALGETNSVYDGQTGADGVGCGASAQYGGDRITTPATTQGAKADGYRRVCACAK